MTDPCESCGRPRAESLFEWRDSAGSPGQPFGLCGTRISLGTKPEELRHEFHTDCDRATIVLLRSKLATAEQSAVLLNSVHRAIGDRDPHGPAATAACCIDWIVDAKEAIAEHKADLAKAEERIAELEAGVREHAGCARTSATCGHGPIWARELLERKATDGDT